MIEYRHRLQWSMLLIYILIVSVQIPILVVVCVIRIEVWIILIREIFSKNVPCLRNTRRTIRLMKLQEIEAIVEEWCLFQTYEVCSKNVSQELLV